MSSTSGMKKPAFPTGKICVSFKGQDGSVKRYSVSRHVTCEDLFKCHCEKNDLSYRSARFLYKGNRITRRSRKLEEMKFGHKVNVEIDVMEHMPGGGGGGM